MNADEQMRAQCLNEAIRSADAGESAESIVSRAEKFLAFIVDKKTPAKKRKR